MKKKKLIIIIIAILVLGAGVYFGRDFLFKPGAVNSGEPAITSGASEEDIAAIPSYVYTQTYTHPTLGFSFKHPDTFSVSTIPNDDGSEAIIVQNITTNIGVQILVTSFEGEDIDLTPDIIKTDIPDLAVKDAQEVLIGENRKGLAFLSDNEAFGGKSREVWFVFRGNLFQISTYAELDPFLRGLFGTWQFN